MDIGWDDLKLFLAVAETGSLSKAARQLRIGQPTVTRKLAALEYEVGAALFRRSVEGASLTTAGERLLPAARKMAEWAGEAGRAAEKADDQAPRGLVRVTSSPFVSVDFLAPFAGWLRPKHPGLRLEVLSSMQYLDLARGEADLALRLKAPTDDDLKVVVACEFDTAVWVSKAVAARLPKKPKLHEVPWIGWAPPYDTMPPNPQLQAAIPNWVPAFSSDNFLVNLAGAEAGLGGIVLPRIKHRFSRANGLVPLDTDLGPFSKTQLFLVCAKSALDIPRVRLVADLLVAELKRIVRC